MVKLSVKKSGKERKPESKKDKIVLDNRSEFKKLDKQGSDK